MPGTRPGKTTALSLHWLPVEDGAAAASAAIAVFSGTETVSGRYQTALQPRQFRIIFKAKCSPLTGTFR
jgi:hypothetical protein